VVTSKFRETLKLKKGNPEPNLRGDILVRPVGDASAGDASAGAEGGAQELLLPVLESRSVEAMEDSMEDEEASARHISTSIWDNTSQQYLQKFFGRLMGFF
jgi:hypothetical protein